MKKKVKEVFDKISKSYDSERKSLIPCFNDFYGIIKELSKTDINKPDILDLGAGTGLLTNFLLEIYPAGNYILLDLSEDMLNIARKRFKERTNIKYEVCDYVNCDFNQKYDIVVSGLSVHHLTDRQKKYLYDKIFKILKKDGIFINADQFLSPFKKIEKMSQDQWIKKIKLTGLSIDRKNGAFERMKLDKPATVDDNIKWLLQSGFKEADLIYKYYNFGVIFARK